ncbi:hypothetical protein BABINDRAFT_111844 [Babjeviella inositovora NRRL Y-12698]|uniref:BHLH domain-containing protein n=1 Tax=Babjeviella inositovora NRRL Y-12698 TaxID=984486 RepID=A0A1E3QVX4_9ASCO|nr:uncharacterized protein BABINDRAFT_111844 [Babjeviella inositovora NRRL Y-12698]ODQ81803.1 hypothetical protein BABINDRAFT_111844 [Babjeviella inositovora NRRL Y-12698]
MTGLKEDPSFSDFTSFGFTSLNVVPSRQQHQEFAASHRAPPSDDFLSLNDAQLEHIPTPDVVKEEVPFADFNLDGFQHNSSNQLIDDLEALTFPNQGFYGNTPAPETSSTTFSPMSADINPFAKPHNGSVSHTPYFNDPVSRNVSLSNQGFQPPGQLYSSYNEVSPNAGPLGRTMSISYNNPSQFASPPVNSPYGNDGSLTEYGSSFGSYDASSLRSPPTSSSYLSGSFSTVRSPRQSIVSLGSPPSVPNLNHGSVSGPTHPKQLLSKDDKLKRRREFHNAVERRRRDLIKEKIRELGNMVPPSLVLKNSGETASPPPVATTGSSRDRDSKPNKSIILNKAVDYVSHLMITLERQKNGLENMQDRLSQLEQMPDIDVNNALFMPPKPYSTETHMSHSSLMYSDNSYSLGAGHQQPHSQPPPQFSPNFDDILGKGGDDYEQQYMPSIQSQLTVNLQSENQRLAARAAVANAKLLQRTDSAFSIGGTNRRTTSAGLQLAGNGYFNPDDFFPEIKVENGGPMRAFENEGDEFWGVDGKLGF